MRGESARVSRSISTLITWGVLVARVVDLVGIALARSASEKVISVSPVGVKGCGVKRHSDDHNINIYGGRGGVKRKF